MDLLPDLLSRTSIKVETALSPAIVVSLGDVTAAGPPSPLMRILRPRVTVIRDGVTILVSEPAGSPELAPPVLIFVALAMVAYLVWLTLQKAA